VAPGQAARQPGVISRAPILVHSSIVSYQASHNGVIIHVPNGYESRLEKITENKTKTSSSINPSGRFELYGMVYMANFNMQGHP
jgi:hypothetical protein